MPPLADYIWMNGEMTPWADAKVHVMSHALHYGTSVFEGIRVYDTPDGPRGFRLTDHVRRLFDSARIYHFALPFTEDEVLDACKAIVRANGLKRRLSAAHRLSGRVRHGGDPGQAAGGRDHRRLSMGRLSGRRGAGEGRGRLCLVLAARVRPTPSRPAPRRGATICRPI